MRGTFAPPLYGLFAAMLALIGQLAMSSLMPMEMTAPRAPTLAELLASPDAICHAEGSDAPADLPAPHRHHDNDCALCPLCAALSVPAVALSPAPVLPPPSLAQPIRFARLPPARAPPARFAAAAQPRGPPASI